MKKLKGPYPYADYEYSDWHDLSLEDKWDAMASKIDELVEAVNTLVGLKG